MILAVDSFDDYLLSGSKDKTVKLWKKDADSFNFKLLATFIGHLEAVSSIQIAPKKGKFFTSVSTDNNLKIWDLKPFTKNIHDLEEEEEEDN